MLSTVLIGQKTFGSKFIQKDRWRVVMVEPLHQQTLPQKLCFWVFNKKYPWATSLLEVVAPSSSKSALWGIQCVRQMFLKSSLVINLAQVGNVEDEASRWKDVLINNHLTISPGVGLPALPVSWGITCLRSVPFDVPHNPHCSPPLPKITRGFPFHHMLKSYCR